MTELLRISMYYTLNGFIDLVKFGIIEDKLEYINKHDLWEVIFEDFIISQNFSRTGVLSLGAIINTLNSDSYLVDLADEKEKENET